MYLKKLRKGVAMIELIFAIVIMGIVMMSAPMLMTQATKSSLVLIQQEAISAGASQISMILTKQWDEADTNESIISPILNTLSTNTMFDHNTSTGKRSGTPQRSSRTFQTSFGELNASNTLGVDINDGLIKDDMDDYNNNLTTISSLTTATNDDYKDNLTLVTTVTYIEDNSISVTSSDTLTFNTPFDTEIGTTRNIKKITITIRSANPTVGTDIRFDAFACNIGSYQLEKKDF